jgi:hypothetical protein
MKKSRFGKEKLFKELEKKVFDFWVAPSIESQGLNLRVGHYELLSNSILFSKGALDLITTSCEILSVDLSGIRSFRHLISQLKEIQERRQKQIVATSKLFDIEGITNFCHIFPKAPLLKTQWKRPLTSLRDAFSWPFIWLFWEALKFVPF